MREFDETSDQPQVEIDTPVDFGHTASAQHEVEVRHALGPKPQRPRSRTTTPRPISPEALLLREKARGMATVETALARSPFSDGASESSGQAVHVVLSHSLVWESQNVRILVVT